MRNINLKFLTSLITNVSAIKNKKSYLKIIVALIGVIFATILTSAKSETASISPVTAGQPTANGIASLPSTLGTSSSSVGIDSDQDKTDDPPRQCQVINWTGNRAYTVKAGLNVETHFIFPEQAVDVVVGNKDLWKEEHSLNHVFIKPTTDRPEGELSNFTYIGQSNNAYEIFLKRVPSNEATPCVIVTRSGSMVNYAAWDKFQNKDKEIIKFMAARMDQQKKQMISQQQSAMDKYRSSLYTRYTVAGDGGWFGTNFITDKYDDGRWTYIRIRDDSKGVPAIYGVLDGKKDLVHPDYDETTKIYRIAGIYQKVILAYGKNTITVYRQPEST